MRRTSMHASRQKSGLYDSFGRLFAKNSVLLIGMAFELGMLLGRRSNLSRTAEKVRDGMSSLADQVVTLAPSSMTKLVPDIFPAKARPATARRKSSTKKRARSRAA